MIRRSSGSIMTRLVLDHLEVGQFHVGVRSCLHLDSYSMVNESYPQKIKKSECNVQNCQGAVSVNVYLYFPLRLHGVLTQEHMQLYHTLYSY
jgi:hypothetical protein